MLDDSWENFKITKSSSVPLSLVVNKTENKPKQKLSKKQINKIDVPDKIIDTYTIDYDINLVDIKIKQQLLYDETTYLRKLKDDLEIYYNKLSLHNDIITCNMLKNLFDNTKKEIEYIESGRKRQNYMNESVQLLLDYNSFSKKNKTVSFGIEDDSYKEFDDELKCKIGVIEDYLQIASKYISIVVTRLDNMPNYLCKGCGQSLANININELGTIRCTNDNCNAEFDPIINTRTNKDSNRSNIISNNDDESIENFLRAFDRYRGVQVNKPPQSLYDELDDYFIKNIGLSGEQIRDMPLKDSGYGYRGKTNHRMLWNALASINKPEYYKDANLIGHVYWGWKLPDVEHLRSDIIIAYNLTQTAFLQIPINNRERKSSLGTQYRLWRHLQLANYPCNMYEFKIAENPESLKLHNKIWRIMCEKSGYLYIE